MKTLILFASRSGVTNEVANYIGKNIKNSTVKNISQNKPNLKKYDLIIIGSGIYFSKIDKKLKKYINHHIDDLLEKKFAIFFTCGTPKDKNIKKIIDKNFKGKLENNALTIDCVGGKILPSEAKWPASTLLWMFKSKNKMKGKKQPEINYTDLDNFIELINSTTIIEDDENSLRKNPVPPIKDIITVKEKNTKVKGPKTEHKQVTKNKSKTTNKEATITEKNTKQNTNPTSKQNTKTTNKTENNKSNITKNNNTSNKSTKTTPTKTNNKTSIDNKDSNINKTPNNSKSNTTKSTTTK